MHKKSLPCSSSNSCKRSTTNIFDGLKPEPRRSTKAFFHMCIKTQVLWKRKVLTFVGTPENSLRSPSMPAPVIGFTKSFISLRATSTLLAMYFRHPWMPIAISRARPRLSSFDFVTRHRGHSTKPLSHIVASKAYHLESDHSFKSVR